MGLFGAIASVASEFRILPSGAANPSDAGIRPTPSATDTGTPTAPTAPTPANAVPTAPAAAAPPTPVLRPLTGALGAQVSDIAARQGAAEVRDSTLHDIGTLFGSNAGTSDLGSSLDAFAQAWQQLAADPATPDGQQEVITHGGTLAATVRSLSQGVEDLSARLNDAATAGIKDLNQTLSDIHQTNRVIVSQAALNRPTDETEAQRDQLVAKVVDLTGANFFRRENKTIALFTSGGQALLDQRPTRFTRAGSGQPAAPDAVPADGRIDNGRLGALLRLTADGSRQTPPQRPSPDPGSEVIRKLRSQLDAVANIVLGRSRANKQPTSFADAYDSAPVTDDSQLSSGFFIGRNRLSLDVNPDLVAGTRTLKTNAAPAVATSLTTRGRQLPVDGLPVPATSYPALVNAVTNAWTALSDNASRDARVAEAANTLMTSQTQGAGSPDLQTGMSRLQTLQTALGSTRQIGHSLGAFMSALGRQCPA